MTVAGDFAPFLPYCFAACYIAFLLARPSRLEWLLVTAAGIALGLGLTSLYSGSLNSASPRIGWWIYGIGFAAALWMVIAPLVGRKSAHPAVALLVVYPLIASTAVHSMNRNGGFTFDRYLLAADGSFGLQAGFAAARIIRSHSLLKWLCDVSYFGLPVAVASLLHTASSRRLMFTCGLLAISSVLAYAAFPAVGAQIAFADVFPAQPPPTNAGFASPVFQPGGLARNFMPSLHMAWGIALLLAAWPLGRRWRIAILVYLAPMLLHTLARHYLCDMIVAVPWALAGWSAVAKRWEAALAYLAAAAAWMLLIRFALPALYLSPVIPWLLTAATVALPVVIASSSADWPAPVMPESERA